MPSRLPLRPPGTPPSPHGLVVLHRSRKRPPDAIALLKADHQRVAALFERYRRWRRGAFASKKMILDQIREELDLHSRIEERLFYPELAQALSEQVKEHVRHAGEEHAVVDRLVSELALVDPDDPGCDAKVKVLRETVERHVLEEQTLLFPEARRWLGDTRLVDLGRKVAGTRQAMREGLGAQVAGAATSAVGEMAAVAAAAVRGFGRGLKTARAASSRRRQPPAKKRGATLRPAPRRKTRGGKG